MPTSSTSTSPTVFSDLLASMREMAITIAPELQLQPFYLLEHPEILPTPDAAGYACHSIPPAIRDRLIERGEWRGPAPCIVLVPGYIASEADTDERSQYSFERLVTQTTIHELAHVLPLRPQPRDSEPTDAQRELQASLFATWAADPDPRTPSWTPWSGDHGPRFTRIALHLAERAARAGYALPFEGLCAGPAYGQQSILRYQMALSDELDRTFDYTLAEIEHMPRPEKFKERWQQDRDAWLADNPQHEEAAA